jgi:cation:H+ antiporter
MKYLIQLIIVGIALLAMYVFNPNNIFSFIIIITASLCCALLTDYPASLVEKAGGALSKRYKIPAVVVGATFLAIASSAPELFTSLCGVVFFKSFSIGMSAILWSSLFNTCMINGVCALKNKSNISVDKHLLSRDMSIFVMVLTLFLYFTLDGLLRHYEFLILILIYVGYIFYLAKDPGAPYKEGEDYSPKYISIQFVLGLSLIAILCYFMIQFGETAIHSAYAIWGLVIPVSVLGATIYGSGTSFADLMVSIKATEKNETGAAISNAIGSNTFDIAIALGFPGLIYTLLYDCIQINFMSVITITIMLYIGIIITSAFLYSGKSLSKREGYILTSYFSICLTIQFYISFKYGY